MKLTKFMSWEKVINRDFGFLVKSRNSIFGLIPSRKIPGFRKILSRKLNILDLAWPW